VDNDGSDEDSTGNAVAAEDNYHGREALLKVRQLAGAHTAKTYYDLAVEQRTWADHVAPVT
jgi:hypothetical protein